MRIWLVLLLVGLAGTQIWASSFREEAEDNEFAEFEDFEDEDAAGASASHDRAPVPSPSSEQPKPSAPDVKPVHDEVDDEDEGDAITEDEEDNEFEHFQDEEEFEGFDNERVVNNDKVDDKEMPKITITKVPLHLRTNWDSFYMEMLMIAGLTVYFVNFFTGRSKNQRIANAWFSTHRQILEENFTLVGDDGKMEIETPGLIKDSEHMYTLWCSGRLCCEGMLVELKLLKRQDLVAVFAQLVRPSLDQVQIRVDMTREDMDSYVFCVATKKTGLRLSKEMQDLSTFCPERKTGDKFGVPSNMCLMSEMGEASSALLDSKVIAMLNKYQDVVEFIHFSDQYSGPKQTEDSTLVKLPEVKRVLIFCFNIPMLKNKGLEESLDHMLPLMHMVFYLIDKVKRFRLGKEGKQKADKNRARVEEAFLKTTHAARAEAAAARREEKRRQEKERIMQEEDPEKQRRWEEKDMKRQMKKKAPKMKQLKVKAL
ncbi:coiled-coil domain-containing protein 47 [Thrips palmi]|uniref:PAT complex subunit CCDC47 n=1 Tax=Thrips palmi TaxID=161013 RepID=A0A6P8ZYV2_THRPL|nr:coiled-coil domain-containing protein 47 [Thrips palmi]XP_034250277.1 coiled-coil domain-containing protein 47 [Thrips palmi]